MGSRESCIVPLVAAGARDRTRAYERFIAEAELSGRVAMELGRKPLDAKRWEELWDAALTLRSALAVWMLAQAR